MSPTENRLRFTLQDMTQIRRRLTSQMNVWKLRVDANFLYNIMFKIRLNDKRLEKFIEF